MRSLPFMFLGCMGPAVFIGLAVVCIRTLWVTLVPPAKMPREAGCGRCGYAVAGLTTSECPECGSNLHEAGIVTPGIIMKYRGGTFGAIVAWTILALGVALAGLSFVGIFAGRRMVSTMTTTPQTWTTPLVPDSKAYRNVDVITVTTFGGRISATSVELDLTLSDGSLWKMEVDPPTRNTRVTSPSGGTGATTGYGSGTVAAFFKSAGLDTSDSKVAAEAKELESIVDIELISPYTQPSQMSLTTFTPGPPKFSGSGVAVAGMAGMDETTLMVILLAGMAWLIVYLAGILFIVARRRRLMGRYPKATVYSPGM